MREQWSAEFIKELMRRSVQFHLERNGTRRGGHCDWYSYLAELDRTFYAEQHKWTGRLEMFIKSHPDQFVHRAPWLSHDTTEPATGESGRS